MENANTNSVFLEGRKCPALHPPYDGADGISGDLGFPTKIDASLQVRAVIGDLEAVGSVANIEVRYNPRNCAPVLIANSKVYGANDFLSLQFYVAEHAFAKGEV
jgi:hypothetical protein